MRLTNLICILMLLVAQHSQLLRGELQGPLDESASATANPLPTDAERTTITSSEYSSSKTESDEIKTEKDAKVPPVDSPSTATAPGVNDRKAAKLKDAEFVPRTKVMPAALLERLWNDSQMKQQKLKAQIEAIEAKLTPVEVQELTPEQMEGQ